MIEYVEKNEDDYGGFWWIVCDICGSTEGEFVSQEAAETYKNDSRNGWIGRIIRSKRIDVCPDCQAEEG